MLSDLSKRKSSKWKPESQARQSRSESQLLSLCSIVSSVATWLMDHATLQRKPKATLVGLWHQLISLVFLALCNPALSEKFSSIYPCSLIHMGWSIACLVFSVPRIQFLPQAAVYLFSPGVILSCSCVLASHLHSGLAPESMYPRTAIVRPGPPLTHPQGKGLSAGEGNKMNEDRKVHSASVSYSCRPLYQSWDVICLMT